MSNYCVHLERKWVNKPREAETQRLSYDVSLFNDNSIYELHQILKYFSRNSNGEFRYWITKYNENEVDEDGDYIAPSITKNVIYSWDLDKQEIENERNTEDIHTLHSGESETNEEGPAE
jgi:hypothetical protein